MHVSRRGRGRGFAVLLAAVTVTSTLVGVAVAAPTPPPNPTDGQLQGAAAAKDALAREIGQLDARVVVLEGQIRQLDSAAQLAEQKLALALQREQQAKAAAALAKDNLARAQGEVQLAHTEFVGYVQAAYMSGDVTGMTGSLLTAADPNVLLQRSTLQAYQADHQLSAIGDLQRATVQQSNAEAVARLSLAAQTATAQQAAEAQQNVLSALSAASSHKAALISQLAAQQRILQGAQIKLLGLTNERAAYQAWQQQQARLAAQRVEQLHQQQLAQQRAAAGNAGAQSGTAAGSPAPLPTGGSWTAAKGREAVNRAMRFVGWPYSWAAGNGSGPTLGVSEPGSAWNDSNIRGFDCSGLTLYAWARWISMDHYAATQYSQAGNYHPSTDKLMPGDLVFWSGDGTIGGIGHEAMYIGNGNVIQAPQSGDIIKITNLFNVEDGYFGATRPLT